MTYTYWTRYWGQRRCKSFDQTEAKSRGTLHCVVDRPPTARICHCTTVTNAYYSWRRNNTMIAVTESISVWYHTAVCVCVNSKSYWKSNSTIKDSINQSILVCRFISLSIVCCNNTCLMQTISKSSLIKNVTVVVSYTSFNVLLTESTLIEADPCWASSRTSCHAPSFRWCPMFNWRSTVEIFNITRPSLITSWTQRPQAFSLSVTASINTGWLA